MSKKFPHATWQQIKCVFEKDGFAFSKRSRKGSSHWVGSKLGTLRPVIIPEYDDVGEDIVRNCMRTAGMDRARFVELLEDC
jgi:hypothetical protein